MKTVGITIHGVRYEIRLDDGFADFVVRDLEESGINFNADNKADKLLKAYLRLAKQVASYEKEIELLVKTLEEL